MVPRSAPCSSGGVLCKRIVRKIGSDFLPIEALDSFENNLPNFNNNNEIAGDDSSWDLQRNVNRCVFAGRRVHFRNKYINDVVVDDDCGINKHDRTWKPNLQLKRLFSYFQGCDIQPKVTVHAVKSVERAGGIYESVLQTPYYKSETRMGLMWKGRIESKWVEFWNKEVGFFSPEEARIAKVLSRLDMPRSCHTESLGRESLESASQSQ